MRKIITIFLLAFAFLAGNGQINQYPYSAGQYYIFDIGNTTIESTKQLTGGKISFENHVEAVDTIFKIPSSAPLDTIATLNSAITAINDSVRVALLFQEGYSELMEYTVPRNNMFIGKYDGVSDTRPLIYGTDTIDGWTTVSPDGETNNLIINDGIETNISSWTFTQATGGVTTFTRSTTNPLVGDASLEIANTTAGSSTTTPSMLQLSSYDGVAGNQIVWGFKYRVNSGTCILYDLNGIGADLNLTLTGTGTFIDTVTSTTYDHFNPRFDGRNLFNVTIDSIFTYIIGTPPQQYVYASNPDLPLTSYYCIVNDTTYAERVASIDNFTKDYQFYQKTDSIFVSTSTFADTSAIKAGLIQESTLVINNKNNITVSGLHLKGSPISTCQIKGGSSNVIISNTVLEESASAAILIWDTTSYVTIRHDTIRNCINNGLFLTTGSHNIDIYENYISNNGLGVGGDRQAIGVWGVNNVNVYNNYIDHSTAGGSVMEASAETGEWLNDSVNVYNNTVISNLNTSSAFQFFSGRFNVHNNLIIGDSTNTTSTTSAMFTGEVRGANLGDDGVYTYLNFYNNTIVGFPYGTKLSFTNGYLVSGLSEINVKNNIFSNIRLDYVTESTASGIDSIMPYIDFDYNLFSVDTGTKWEGLADTKYNFTDWTTNTGHDINSTIGNPLFVGSGDYSLQVGSPAINNGVDVGLTTDMLGNPIVGNPDIGAYEKQ